MNKIESVEPCARSECFALQFRTISTASACLFSLVNGDDMFVTFSAIRQDQHVPGYVWIFSQAYLYIFVSLFIYVVLNLFIAVILDTYEVIKVCGFSAGISVFIVCTNL